MYNKRIQVQLISKSHVDEVLLATLNRFHFKTVYLNTKVVSLHVLRYTNKIDQTEHNVVIMPNANEDISLAVLLQKAEIEGKKVIKRDYLKEIAHHFNIYLKCSDKIKNWSHQDSEQTLPVTDILADQFETDLIEKFRLSPAPATTRFALALTHDVDCIGNYPVGNLKSSLVFLINSVKTIRYPRLSLFYLKAATRFLLGQVNYYGFEQILEIAKKQNFRPIFFFFARLVGENKLSRCERYLHRNPNYDLNDNELAHAFKVILEFGAEIGIHGSYKSAGDFELLRAEKNRLEKVTGQTCLCIRQHYMNFHGRTSYDIYSRIGLEIDASCGFVTENGYICGTTRPFYAVLPHKGGNQVIVLPMVFMDAVPLYFKPQGISEVFSQLKQILQYLKKFNGFTTANFHQRMISCFPEYRQLYEDLAVEVRKMGGEIVTPGELDRIFPEYSIDNRENRTYLY